MNEARKKPFEKASNLLSDKAPVFHAVEYLLVQLAVSKLCVLAGKISCLIFSRKVGPGAGEILGNRKLLTNTFKGTAF